MNFPRELYNVLDFFSTTKQNDLALLKLSIPDTETAMNLISLSRATLPDPNYMPNG